MIGFNESSEGASNTESDDDDMLRVPSIGGDGGTDFMEVYRWIREVVALGTVPAVLAKHIGTLDALVASIQSHIASQLWRSVVRQSLLRADPLTIPNDGKTGLPCPLKTRVAAEQVWEAVVSFVLGADSVVADDLLLERKDVDKIAAGDISTKRLQAVVTRANRLPPVLRKKLILLRAAIIRAPVAAMAYPAPYTSLEQHERTMEALSVPSTRLFTGAAASTSIQGRLTQIKALLASISMLDNVEVLDGGSVMRLRSLGSIAETRVAGSVQLAVIQERQSLFASHMLATICDMYYGVLVAAVRGSTVWIQPRKGSLASRARVTCAANDAIDRLLTGTVQAARVVLGETKDEDTKLCMQAIVMLSRDDPDIMSAAGITSAWSVVVAG